MKRFDKLTIIILLLVVAGFVLLQLWPVAGMIVVGIGMTGMFGLSAIYLARMIWKLNKR